MNFTGCFLFYRIMLNIRNSFLPYAGFSISIMYDPTGNSAVLISKFFDCENISFTVLPCMSIIFPFTPP